MKFFPKKFYELEVRHPNKIVCEQQTSKQICICKLLSQQFCKCTNCATRLHRLDIAFLAVLAIFSSKTPVKSTQNGVLWFLTSRCCWKRYALKTKSRLQGGSPREGQNDPFPEATFFFCHFWFFDLGGFIEGAKNRPQKWRCISQRWATC